MQLELNIQPAVLRSGASKKKKNQKKKRKDCLCTKNQPPLKRQQTLLVLAIGCVYNCLYLYIGCVQTAGLY